MPKRIANAPELRIGLEIYYAAFLDLISDRAGMGDGPISWLVINEYAKRHHLDDEQAEDLYYYLSALDETYLGHVKQKNKGGKQADGPKTMGKT